MEFNLLEDIYYKPEYISLYLEPDGELFEFSYKEGNKEFLSRCIKRPIKQLEGFFDLESAYGYGGFYINTNDSSFIKRAFDKYRNYCKEHNIVAQFVRFHPFDEKVEVFKPHLDFFAFNRPTVYVDLKNELRYSSTLKRNIKKAKKYPLETLLLKANREKLVFLDLFVETYYETMRKNNAAPFYFFSKNYFKNLLLMEDSKLFVTLYEGKIAVNFILVLESPKNGIAYYHLGATKGEYYSLNVNPLTFDFAINYYKSKNFKFFYLGGGRTPNKEDSLLRFKKKFSSLEKPFYIGGLTFNSQVYENLKVKIKHKLDKFLFWRQ